MADLLDVRPADVAGTRPIFGAVNVPLAVLPSSAGELCHRETPLRVAGTGPEAAEAVAVLHGMRRHAVVEDSFSFGGNPFPLRLWEPNAFLLEVLPQLRGDRALELACGAGREATTLASYGWQVSAIDHLPESLERAERLAERFGLGGRIQWTCAELEQWSPDVPSDLATMFFFLDRDVIRRVVSSLAPGGSFVMETFTPTHRDTLGKPRRKEFVVSAEEAPDLVSGMELLHLSEAWRESGRHTLRLWARK